MVVEEKGGTEVGGTVEAEEGVMAAEEMVEEGEEMAEGGGEGVRGEEGMGRRGGGEGRWRR